MTLKKIREDLEHVLKNDDGRFNYDFKVSSCSPYDVEELCKMTKFLERKQNEHAAAIHRENSYLRRKAIFKASKEYNDDD
jgi:hypothetical protein